MQCCVPPAHTCAGQICCCCVALQYESSNGSSSASSIAGPEPPLLWMAEELVAPLGRQLLEVFGPNVQGSPGDVNSPALVLAVVHRLAQDNAPRIDFLQVGGPSNSKNPCLKYRVLRRNTHTNLSAARDAAASRRKMHRGAALPDRCQRSGAFTRAYRGFDHARV